MPNVKKLKLPSGTTYDIEDAQAREDIEDLKSSISGGMQYLGITTTALTDGSTTSTITIDGDSVTVTSEDAGDVVIYGELEFVWNGSKWQEFGSMGNLKALAFKDSASGSFTPSGSISTPTITVTPSTATIKTIDSVGTLPTATMPTFSATVSNEVLTLGWEDGSFDQGTLPTRDDTTVVVGIASASSTQPSFTGTSGTVTVS